VPSRKAIVLSDGRSLLLDSQLGKGGEGTVFSVTNDQKIVAKVYNQQINAQKAAKLDAMARMADADLLRFAAWPISTIKDRGVVCGFVMPKLVGYRPLHDLYNPASRKQNFPRADFKYLVHASRNLSAAVAAIHKRGCVIGDVNQGNAYVHETNATIALIDCDSFQIASSGQNWLCEVGVAHFTPPELQNISGFGAVIRTPNHDAFGLAVLLFHLLMFGRHPYAGLYPSSTHVLLEEAIKRNWFTYSSNASKYGVKPPPGTASLNTLGPDVWRFFENAFGPNYQQRPQAHHWVTALDSLERSLKRCEEDGAHVYPNHLASCPWCKVEEATGTLLFVSRVHVVPTMVGRFNIGSLWAMIEKIRPPEPKPPLSPDQVATPAPTVQAQQENNHRAGAMALRFIALAVGIGLTIAIPAIFYIAFGIAWFLWTKANEIGPNLKPYNDVLQAAMREYERGCSTWEERTSNRSFQNIKDELTNRRREYEGLSDEYNKGLDEINRRAQELQLARYLQGFMVHSATIKGVGDARKSTLQSFGISTAADISRKSMSKVPGFGTVLTNAVISWRESKVARFKFDPKRGADPNDVATLYKRVEHKRRELEAVLNAGVQRLEAASKQIQRERELLAAPLLFAANAVAQARENVQFIKGK
jgi:DNA-binding helix-hairpin-helix protein with protein kinase domain